MRLRWPLQGRRGRAAAREAAERASAAADRALDVAEERACRADEAIERLARVRARNHIAESVMHAIRGV